MEGSWTLLSDENLIIKSGSFNGNLYFWDEYISKGGFGASQTNSNIHNFKKSIERKIYPKEWEYKEKAIFQFANDLNVFQFPDGAFIIPAPTSKPRTSEIWDSRLDDTAEKLHLLNSSIEVYTILDLDTEMLAAHNNGGTRNPEEIKKHLIISRQRPICNSQIFLIDDVITTGGHYKAYCDKLRIFYPNVPINGLFWARTIQR